VKLQPREHYYWKRFPKNNIAVCGKGRGKKGNESILSSSRGHDIEKGGTCSYSSLLRGKRGDETFIAVRLDFQLGKRAQVRQKKNMNISQLVRGADHSRQVGEETKGHFLSEEEKKKQRRRFNYLYDLLTGKLSLILASKKGSSPSCGRRMERFFSAICPKKRYDLLAEGKREKSLFPDLPGGKHLRRT